MPKKSSTASSRRHWSKISERTSDEALTGLTKTVQRVGVAADHGGFELKEYLVGKLREAGHEVVDFGDRRPKPDDDYPDFVVPLARAVASGEVERGVAICGSGVGASVVANKVAGVRACLIHETFSAHQGVEDDDLNMICLGGRVVGHALAWELVQTFLAARFSGAERHRRRLAKVAVLEKHATKENKMSKQTPVSKPIYSLLPTEVEGFDSLAELALDMRWSWNHCADEVWRRLDPALWDLTQNPWVVLQTVSRDQLERVLADPAFRKNVDDLLRAKRQAAEAPAWFQQHHPQAPLTCVAYFSMEFMLSEALPIYSGGLGNVAGDQLKAASDLGVPVVGVGLLYQQGYFRQVIDKDGAQQALYPYNDPGQLPITPLRQPNGEWLRLEIALPGYSVWLRAWQVQVGRVKLYLLDSNDAANFPAHRGITSELYGGGPELRLKQELLLGIGGWRLLAALGIQPEVCHLNEGHAAFAVLERARSFMQETAQPFDVALAATRAGNLFTTHTAVAAGFDRFAPALIEQYLGGYAKQKLGISLHDLLALGRQNPNDSSESFNMAYLAIRGSGAVNGVSRLHGEVSRHLFEPLFPALASGRSARRTRDQRGSHADLGLGGSRRSLDGSLWKRPLAGDDGNPGAGHSPRLRRQALAISHRRQQVSR